LAPGSAAILDNPSGLNFARVRGVTPSLVQRSKAVLLRPTHGLARPGGDHHLPSCTLDGLVSRSVCAGCAARLWLVVATCALGCGSPGSQRDPIGDGREAAACPAFLDLEFVAKDSRFDPGWTGNTHGVGLATGSRLSVKVDECEPGCRRCKFRGPVRGDPVKTPAINQRCLQKISRICSTDIECGTDGPCRYVFPPIASTVANTCTLAYFEPFTGSDPSPVQGFIDLVTGETDMPVLNIQLSLSPGNCVDCLGDPTPSDGMAGGKCRGTDVACDLNGTGTAVPSSTSFDCAPDPAIATIVLGTNGTSTSSVVWKMDETTRPLCTASTANTRHCWCGVCTKGTPCIADKDCPTGEKCGAAKAPGSVNIPWTVANNSCPGKCNFNATTQRGTCMDTGAPCFPDGGEIVATGGTEVHEDFLISQLANLICMPSFNTGVGAGVLVDIIGGFPGPFLFEARFRVETRSGP
jgi:hypothetical protein